MPNKNFSPRQWQKDALDKYLRTKPSLFTIGAVPGAGKSKCAAAIAAEMLGSGEINTIIAISPQGAKKMDWKEDFFDFFGIVLDDKYGSSRTFRHGGVDNYKGVILTYAGLSVPSIVADLQRICSHPKYKVMVIADEVHHLSDDGSWGQAFDQAFRNAPHKLYLSGTYWRTDGQVIPGMKIDPSTNTYRTDVSYSLLESLQDGNSRKPEFEMDDPVVHYDDFDGEVYRGKFSEMPEDKINRAYSYLVKQRDKHTKVMLQKALEKLHDVRTVGKWKMPNAGMIVFAPDQEAAMALKDWLYTEDFGFTTSTVVISANDDKSIDTIDAFKKSNDKVIICVNMISEGVDIPRLRVGVFLSRYKSRLYFMQSIVGRLIRVLQSEYIAFQNGEMVVPNSSYAFLFKHPSFLEYTTEMERAIEIAEKAISEREYLPTQRSGDSSLFQEAPLVDVISTGESSRVVDGQYINGQSVALMERLFQNTSNPISPKDKSAIASGLAALIQKPEIKTSPVSSIHPNDMEEVLRPQLANAVNGITRLLVNASNKDHSVIVRKVWVYLAKSVGVGSLSRRNSNVNVKILRAALKNAREIRSDLSARPEHQLRSFITELDFKPRYKW
jgi:superfamily II DNA or RNA helicase